MINENIRETMTEVYAAEQHNIWSDWMIWLFQCSHVNADGSVTIPAEKVHRWTRQMNTPYDMLSEEEKESDRIQVRRMFAAGDRANDAPPDA